MASASRFVKQGVFVLVAMAFAGSAGADVPKEGGKEKDVEAKGEPLYNGKDLSGWEEVGTKNTWQAKGEVLACTGGGGGWLSTKDEYGDFELDLEWKVPEAGNSGVFLRTPREGNPAFVGMEIQVLDDAADIHKHIKEWQHTGSIYGVVPPAKPAWKKAGEWNRYVIRCKGPKVTITLNGEPIVDASMDDHKELKDRPRKGYIGLQNHGSGVEYRNIRVKKLD